MASHCRGLSCSLPLSTRLPWEFPPSAARGRGVSTWQTYSFFARSYLDRCSTREAFESQRMEWRTGRNAADPGPQCLAVASKTTAYQSDVICRVEERALSGHNDIWAATRPSRLRPAGQSKKKGVHSPSGGRNRANNTAQHRETICIIVLLMGWPNGFREPVCSWSRLTSPNTEVTILETEFPVMDFAANHHTGNNLATNPKWIIASSLSNQISSMHWRGTTNLRQYVKTQAITLKTTSKNGWFFRKTSFTDCPISSETTQ